MKPRRNPTTIGVENKKTSNEKMKIYSQIHPHVGKNAANSILTVPIHSTQNCIANSFFTALHAYEADTARRVNNLSNDELIATIGLLSRFK